jgi:hypothetical protein
MTLHVWCPSWKEVSLRQKAVYISGRGVKCSLADELHPRRAGDRFIDQPSVWLGVARLQAGVVQPGQILRGLLLQASEHLYVLLVLPNHQGLLIGSLRPLLPPDLLTGGSPQPLGVVRLHR